jgi:hypothetical protein
VTFTSTKLGPGSGDVRFVQGGGVDHRLHPALEGAVHHRPVRDGADEVGVEPGGDVQAGDGVTDLSEARRQETAEPAGGAGEKQVHRGRLIVRLGL